MPTHRARVRRAVRRTATSLGELISAIYDGLQGPPSLRADQTARVLASPALARRLSRPIRLTA